MDTTPQFPLTAPDDPSDVALAIETAGALWRQGDAVEALKWLRRAAESAETEGDDMRALTLARAAADLKDSLPQLASVVPAARPSAPAPASGGPASTAPSSPPKASPARSAPPPREAPGSRSGIPPAPTLVSSLTTDLGLGPQKLEAWSPPSSRVTPYVGQAPAPGAAAPVRGAEPVTPVAPSAAPPLTSATSSASAAAEVASALVSAPTSAPAPAPVAAPAPVTAAASDPAPASVARKGGVHPALRVSVEVLSKGSGSLLVRVLGEGEAPAAGAHEALLVPLTAGVDLRHP